MSVVPQKPQVVKHATVMGRIVYRRPRHFFRVSDLQRIMKHILLYDKSVIEPYERSYIEFYEILVALIFSFLEVHQIQLTTKLTEFVQGFVKFLLESLNPKNNRGESSNGKTSY